MPELCNRNVVAKTTRSSPGSLQFRSFFEVVTVELRIQTILSHDRDECDDLAAFLCLANRFLKKRGGGLRVDVVALCLHAYGLHLHAWSIIVTISHDASPKSRTKTRWVNLRKNFRTLYLPHHPHLHLHPRTMKPATRARARAKEKVDARVTSREKAKVTVRTRQGQG